MKKLFPVAILFAAAPFAAALNVVLDYSLDAANGNFFGTTPAAKAAVDAAAADIGAAIVQTLGAVPTDIFTGVNGGSTATLNWSLSYTNPSTGATDTVPTFSFAANTVKIFVGVRPLAGTTLGVGGPGGAGVAGGISFSTASENPGAVAAAQASSNASMPRGGGPVMGSLSGSLGGTPYTIQYGAMIGSLSLDNDSDNNGLADSAATLATYWHYDHTTAVAATKNDMYSVALHEILHSIGFGTAATWTGLHTGATWNGTNATALNGGTAVGLSADQSHVIDSFTSTRLSDGGTQEVVMDPSLTVGTRKLLTQMDLAFLRDIGYATVPEPSAAFLLLAGCVGLLSRRVREG